MIPQEQIDNNFRYHDDISQDQITKLDTIRVMAKRFAEEINTLCPDSREKSLAITNLEQCMMWSNAAITRVTP